MKRKHLILFFLFAVIFSSCVKDTEYRTYTLKRAEYSISEKVKEGARMEAAREIKDPGSFILFNNTMYINEKDKGIHVIDYSNLSNPVNKGFIPIPGNRGVSIKENYLYADCYIDLFVFRIHSNVDIRLENSLHNVFPSRRWATNADTSVIKVKWSYKDTTVVNNAAVYTGMQYYSADPTSSYIGPLSGPTSVGSSLVVFTIVKDHLYTVSDNNLSTFSLNNKQIPVLKNTQFVGTDVETIFPFKEHLFIGSRTGMFIYNIGNPENPAHSSRFTHAQVCDPVIADDHFAFVTLRSGNLCGGNINQMDVLDITNIGNPVLIRSYPFSNPHGLSKDGKVLFVCDGLSGLKVLDASNVNNIVLKHTLSIGNVLDVVAIQNLAFVMLDNSIKIYSYDQQFNLNLQSTINTH